MAYEELVTVDGSASSWQVPCADGMGGFVWGTPPSSDIASSTTITIPASSWSSSGTATVTALGVTIDGIVMVSPSAGSIDTVADCGIFCSEQGNSTLTFTANTNPISSVTYNVVIISKDKTTPHSNSQRDVIFIDYDGTELCSYSKEEINMMSDLPENPSHIGLVAQGWNWTLADIKTQLTAMPNQPVIVGQLYVTESGKTEIDIVLDDTMKSPILRLQAVTSTLFATIEWGDGSSTEKTGSYGEIQHEYTNGGSYTIKINITEGQGYLYGNGYHSFFHGKINNSDATGNEGYCNAVKAIRMGRNMSLRAHALNKCSCLETIATSNSTFLTELQTTMFMYDYYLKCVVINHGVVSISNNAFSSCIGIKAISLPVSVTSIGNSAFIATRYLELITLPYKVETFGTQSIFENCHAIKCLAIPPDITEVVKYFLKNSFLLENIIIPNGVETIAQEVFYSSNRLKSAIIPNSVTTIGQSAFSKCSCLYELSLSNQLETIGNYAFENCYSLNTLTIPATVTSIGDKAFNGCTCLKEIHILPSTPPTIGTTIFQSVPLDYTIYVPQGSLSAYQAATNWSEYASYMQEES